MALLDRIRSLRERTQKKAAERRTRQAAEANKERREAAKRKRRIEQGEPEGRREKLEVLKREIAGLRGDVGSLASTSSVASAIAERLEKSPEDVRKAELRRIAKEDPELAREIQEASSKGRKEEFREDLETIAMDNPEVAKKLEEVKSRSPSKAYRLAESLAQRIRSASRTGGDGVKGDDSKAMFRRAERAATAGPPIDGSMDPAASVGVVELLATPGALEDGEAGTMEDLVLGRDGDPDVARRPVEEERDPLMFDDPLGAGATGGAFDDGGAVEEREEERDPLMFDDPFGLAGGAPDEEEIL